MVIACSVQLNLGSSVSTSLNSEKHFFFAVLCIETSKKRIVEQRHTHTHTHTNCREQKIISNCNKGESFSFWKIECDDVHSRWNKV